MVQSEVRCSAGSTTCSRTNSALEVSALERIGHAVADRASLESLIETGILSFEILHPGGLELTRELVELCNIWPGASVLDVACGTGETVCFVAERWAARVYGVDRSEQMIRRAEAKARARGVTVQFATADAARLPFGDAVLDAAICECTLCFLDKERVIREMVRVVRSGGCVGVHDLCWMDDTPDGLKRTLAEIEGERPETLQGWRRLFTHAGLIQVSAVDKSDVMQPWIREYKKQLGLSAKLTLVLRILRRWGVQGLRRVLQSERVFSSGLLGYGMLVGIKP